MAQHEGLPIVPILVIGGIGWYLYNNWGSVTSLLPSSVTSLLPPVSNPPVSNSPATNTNTNTVSNPVVLPVQTTPQQQTPAPANLPITDNMSVGVKMATYVLNDPSFFTHGYGVATFDEWNWLRGQFESNSETIEDIFPGMDRNSLMSMNDYWNGLNSKGVSGLGYVRGNVPKFQRGGAMGLGEILDPGAFFGKGPRRNNVIVGNF